MTEGKVRPYLAYALGEIVLVVIGILIALQINNWHEDSLDRELEREYLASMISDLREDARMIDEALEGNTVMLDGLNNLLIMLAHPQPDPEYQRELLKHSIVRTYWYLTAEFSELTMSQLKYSGRLRLIQNKEVIDAMLKYEQGLELCRTQNENMLNYFHVQEASQKQLFNLMLGKAMYERIEENYLNMLEPLETFDPLLPEGPYLLSNDPQLISTYYGDIMFYRTAMSTTMTIMRQQKVLAEALIELIQDSYAIDVDMAKN